MVKILVNLSEDEDRKVSLFKIDQKLETKELAIKEIIRRLPVAPQLIGNPLICKNCGEITDSFEADNDLCLKCQNRK